MYSGVIPAFLSIAPSNAVFYTVYDLLKTNHMKAVQGGRKCREISETAEKSRRGIQVAEGGEETEAMDPRFNLVYGGLAGIAAATSVYPMEVLRRRLQLIQAATRNGSLDAYVAGIAGAMAKGAKMGGPGAMAAGGVRTFGNLRSLTSLFDFIVRKEGLKGLYLGLLPTACQVLPSAAISYYIFEECKKRLQVIK